MNRDARKNVNHVFPVLASMHLHLDESTDKSLNRRELFSEIALCGHERLKYKYRYREISLFPRRLFLNIGSIEFE